MPCLFCAAGGGRQSRMSPCFRRKTKTRFYAPRRGMQGVVRQSTAMVKRWPGTGLSHAQGDKSDPMCVSTLRWKGCQWKRMTRMERRKECSARPGSSSGDQRILALARHRWEQQFGLWKGALTLTFRALYFRAGFGLVRRGVWRHPDRQRLAHRSADWHRCRICWLYSAVVSRARHCRSMEMPVLDIAREAATVGAALDVP